MTPRNTQTIPTLIYQDSKQLIQFDYLRILKILPMINEKISQLPLDNGELTKVDVNKTIPREQIYLHIKGDTRFK